MGGEVPVLLEEGPDPELAKHWREWLPVFSPITITSIEDGLLDDTPIVTTTAIQSIPANKHAVDPSTMYRLQLKSEISHINVSSPKQISPNEPVFPCILKVDYGYSGKGNFVVHDNKELEGILSKIEGNGKWKPEFVLQEYIEGVIEVPSYTFYLSKRGRGVARNRDKRNGWNSGSRPGKTRMEFRFTPWEDQERLKNNVYEDFVIPVKNYPKKNGYFGIVNFEVIDTKSVGYLCDINPRVSGSTTHILIAAYMSDLGLPKSRIIQGDTFPFSAKALIAKANAINNERDGARVIVTAASDVDDGSRAYVKRLR